MAYTIGKVAERVGLSTYTLRYYEKEGLLPGIQKNGQGIRIYQEDDIFWIELIKCLKETGMSIADIHYIVELSMEGEHTIPQRKQILNAHKRQLQEQMEIIQRSVHKIDKKIEWYDGKTKECE
ncbi:MerR family transcriptional regulator [Niameybacter massiliensis]|uniref:MerR family transcriptional regulator n=1 Tax=Holtiella tumoricola TaxID=3018743 RepID=A0AA42DNM3_9FIRM|nr:MerR family transcriptional regulator [Holtiella tumoricola]MDA3732147.1 MerR family transcriptional regulator [Holtiella tumoricola]